ASDRDRRLDAARADELVDREPRACAIAEPEPADPGGQSLERDPGGRKVEPTLEGAVLRKQLLQRRVDRRDVARLPGERRPPERADPPAEERPDIGRDEARV